MKKSLKLKDLKVQSFITSLDANEKQTIAGGARTQNAGCGTKGGACKNTNAPFCIEDPTDATRCFICPPLTEICEA